MQYRHKSFHEQLKSVLMKPSSTPMIFLDVNTWFKDNQGLYDYQAQRNSLAKENFAINYDCKIYRHTSSGKIRISEENKPEDITSIFYDHANKQYRIQSADNSGVKPHHFIQQEQPDLFRNSYIVINDFNKIQQYEGYPLQVGNIIKLGKAQYIVIQIKDNLFDSKILKQTSYLQKGKGVYIINDQIVKGSCRICLCEQNNSKDPLITPCKCRGSCAAVHVTCLKSWINSKIKKDVGNLALSYNFSKFQCEICKFQFPKTVIVENNLQIQMLEYQKSDKPYIILQSQIDKKQSKRDRVVHILFPSEYNSVKVGRGHKCEIKVDDITVSRTHAQFSYINNRFFVKDLNSKFGTLIKFREQLILKDKIKLQSGRTTLTFSLKKPCEKKNKYFSKYKQDIDSFL